MRRSGSLENRGLATIDVAKHRNGPTGEVKLHFSDKYTKFQDLAPDDPALKIRFFRDWVESSNICRDRSKGFGF